MAIRATAAGGLMTSIASATATSSPSCNSTNMVVFVKVPPLNSSFFGQGVGVMKHRGVRLAYTLNTRPNRHAGGALGTQMNLFDRFSRVVKSYANAVISSFEDPEKILEQTVLEMNDDLIKLRQATAQVLASQKQLENKYKSAEKASEDWYRRAQLALGKGDEDLAREALKRRKSYADSASSLKTQLDQQKGVVDNLVSKTRLTIDDLEGKFALLESSSVDDDFANLKKEMSGSSKKGDLPPGRTAAVAKSSTPFPFKDSEIEKELNELRRKASDF